MPRSQAVSVLMSHCHSALIISDMGAAKVGEELSAPREAHRLLRAHPSLGRTPRSHGRG